MSLLTTLNPHLLASLSAGFIDSVSTTESLFPGVFGLDSIPEQLPTGSPWTNSWIPSGVGPEPIYVAVFIAWTQAYLYHMKLIVRWAMLGSDSFLEQKYDAEM